VYRGQGGVVYYVAWDTAANDWKTGDAGNHSLRLVKDGGSPASLTNSPAEVDSTNMRGHYKVTLTATESQANTIGLGGVSSTSDVVIMPITIHPIDVDYIVDKVWDEILNASSHNTANSAGRRLRTLNADVVIYSGTATAGSTNTISLGSGASATNDVYAGQLITLTSGTGVGQTRRIIDYVGSTKVATVDRNWTTNPANGTGFDITASTSSGISVEGVLASATSTTAVLGTEASSVDDIYNNGIITIVSGTGAGQFKDITDYVGSTKTVTIDGTWSVTPNSTSGYAVVPSGSQVEGGTSSAPSAAENATAVWAALRAANATSGSFGEALDVVVSSRLADADYTEPPTAAAVADAVWDEARSGHANSGSFGEALDAQVSTRLATAGYTAPDNSGIASILVDTAAILADTTDIATAGAIADAVWDEARAGHVGAGSFGEVLDAKVTTRLAAADYAAAPSAGSVADAVWDEARSGHATSGSFGEALDVQVSTRLATAGYTAPDNAGIAAILVDTAAILADTTNIATAGAIADAVWDEARAGHVGAGSFGEVLDAKVTTRLAAADYAAAPSAGSVADAVWDEARSGHANSGSFGEALDVQVSTRLATAGYTAPDNATIALILDDTTAILASGGGGATAADIADAVWDEARAGHVGVGSFGEVLDAKVTTRLAAADYAAAPSAGSVADAVWDEARSGHANSGSFGEALDAQVSTRLATAGYTAPDNASIAAILEDTGTTGVPVVDKTGFRLSATGVNDILRTGLTENYAGVNDAPTLEQAIFAIQQYLHERSLSSTILTVKRLDGSTAMTFTVDSATEPTSQARAT